MTKNARQLALALTAVMLFPTAAFAATMNDETMGTAPIDKSDARNVVVVHPKDAPHFQRLMDLLAHESSAVERMNGVLSMGGGGGLVTIPAPKLIPISSITGKDQASMDTLNKEITLRNDQIKDLRVAIANNPAVLGALSSAKIDAENVIAVDVASTGQLEIYTR